MVGTATAVANVQEVVDLAEDMQEVPAFGLYHDSDAGGLYRTEVVPRLERYPRDAQFGEAGFRDEDGSLLSVALRLVRNSIPCRAFCSR